MQEKCTAVQEAPKLETEGEPACAPSFLAPLPAPLPPPPSLAHRLTRCLAPTGTAPASSVSDKLSELKANVVLAMPSFIFYWSHMWLSAGSSNIFKTSHPNKNAAGL